MFENIYFSIFTVESFIPFIFLFLGSLFLFGIPQKSKATFHIAMSLIIFSTIPFSYLLVSSIYHPLTAYNRWIAAYTSIPSALHVILVFFHFPNTIKPKLAKIILIAGWVLSIIGWAAFIAATSNVGTKYLFSGHNYDMDAAGPQRIVAAAILLMVGLFTITGIWRAIRERGKNSILVLAILFSYLIVTVAPGITNLWSRQGIITRGTFMATLDILTVLGLFSLIIIYINNVRERTSFMIKIIGISLITILLVMQFVSDFLMNEKEADFDHQKYLTSRLVIYNDRRPEDLKYQIEYNLKDSQKSSLDNYQDETININFNQFKGEYLNAFFMESISGCSHIQCVKSELQRNLYNKFYFKGYRNTYLEFAENVRGSNDDKELLALFTDKVLDFQNILRRYRVLAYTIPEENFQNDFRKKFLNKDIEQVKYFQNSIKEYIKNNPSAFNKENITLFFSIAQKPERRFYRKGVKSGQHYISYLIADLDKETVTEVGFDYLSFRKYAHKPAKVILIMLSIVLLFLLIGFRVFFWGALVKPLNTLLDGLKEVQKGDLDVTLKVQVEDEIGFITRSFNSMVRAIKAGELKLQRYAKGLEGKVQKRTAELSETLEAVQRLKSQQDGDYFLTSLILKPLGSNRAESKNIKIDFIVEQKKKFKFRKWESDIGGDICITDNIELNNKKFTVFVNGDAMGKSLQGAGGAMVLGAAFQSILERSRFSVDVKRQSPERWLKNAFTEMHAIFESFDGSMLMSAVIGLIDDSSGLMYFINAEHPWVALYRDGKAGFIENDSIFRKLGSAILAGNVFVQTFQLNHGDVIFSGSDGRDDVLLGMTEKGERIINEDETVFLRAIEKAEGRLDDTIDEIKKMGELTDDLSLIRIEYSKPEEMDKPDELLIDYLSRAKIARKNKKITEAIQILERARDEEKKRHPKLAKELFKSYIITKKYSNAASCGTIYCTANPSDTQSLFALSYSLKMSKQYKKAIDVGERVRLREPKMVNNLINLSECYFKIKEYARAKKIAEEAATIDSRNSRIRTILNMLHAKGI